MAIKFKRLVDGEMYLGHSKENPVYGIYIKVVSRFAYIWTEGSFEYLRTEDYKTFNPFKQDSRVQRPVQEIKRLKLYTRSFKIKGMDKKLL